MNTLAPPPYLVEFTKKTVDAILSAAAIGCEEVMVDVYARNDATQKFEAKGQRIAQQTSVFRITVEHDGKTEQCDFNYTLLRESADRNRRQKK